VFGSARDTTLNVLGPVRSAVDSILSPFANAWNGIANFDELEEENARLNAELAGVEGAALEVRELQRRLREFEILNDLRTSENVADRVIASVIDDPISNFERTVELNRGSTDDIVVGMPVESGAGLIGEVVQVVRNRSRVELVSDASFAVAVRLVRSGDTGVASGNGIGRPLTVQFIDIETVVVPGESVVTSGLDGSRFPSGILVGTVVAARPNPVTGFQEVDIEPIAKLDRLTLVQVVLYRPPVIDNRPVGTTTTTSTTTDLHEPTPDTDPTPEPTAPTAPPRTTVTQVEPPTSAPAQTTTPPTSTEDAAGPTDPTAFVESLARLPAVSSGGSSTKLSDVSELDRSAQ